MIKPMKKCKICNKKFNVIRSQLTCSLKCSLINKKLVLKNYYQKNKIRLQKSIKLWHKNHPWYSHCNGAKQRCINPNLHDYFRYGGKGLKFLMTPDDFEYIWFRDKAHLLKRPSIDRIDDSGNYELSNCRFIENTLNNSLAHRGEKSSLSKLTEKQVKRIRKLYKTGNYIHKQLGIKFKIDTSTVTRIVNNQSWGWLYE
ncbi:hypothetical protein LCGC14_2536800 [marine sediment metagenome]|uniref:Uncharacterized protein n=1 Tax=marine sediment metagenome TaxID=412755 RepID=A0A0F9ARY1_9ZZZZ